MDLSAAISSLAAIHNVANALITERDGIKAMTIKSELMEKVLTAQTQLMQVIAHASNQEASITELNRQLQQLMDAKLERDRYRLERLGPQATVIAYRLKPREELKERVDEPDHFVCQPCLDSDRRSVLHVGPYECFCPACKTRGFIASKRMRHGTF